MSRSRAAAFCVALSLAVTISQQAWGQAPQPAAAPAEESPAPSAPAKVLPIAAPERTHSVEPQPLEPPSEPRTTFTADPIADTALITLSWGFAIVLELITGTGEIRPQQIDRNFERGQLLAIDRAALDLTPSPSARTSSNIVMLAAIGFGFVDPVLSGIREKSVQTGVVDGVLYAESMALTMALTNMVKLAVRRPRPQAYLDAEANRGNPDYFNTSTDSTLSFFSGHASTTAAVGATATYLAFARSPRSARPWITLAVATGLSTFVSIQRVRTGKHFPTDVIAGSIAGAGIGIIVPHLHRSEETAQRRVWVGFAPADSSAGARGGLMNVTGFF